MGEAMTVIKLESNNRDNVDFTIKALEELGYVLTSTFTYKALSGYRYTCELKLTETLYYESQEIEAI